MLITDAIHSCSAGKQRHETAHWAIARHWQQSERSLRVRLWRAQCSKLCTCRCKSTVQVITTNPSSTREALRMAFVNTTAYEINRAVYGHCLNCWGSATNQHPCACEQYSNHHHVLKPMSFNQMSLIDLSAWVNGRLQAILHERMLLLGMV